jgi:hypothetical protein
MTDQQKLDMRYAEIDDQNPKTKNLIFGVSGGLTQTPIQWVPGALFLGVKRQGGEADHSLPNSAEVKKIWIHTSTSSYAFMV